MNIFYQRNELNKILYDRGGAEEMRNAAVDWHEILRRKSPSHTDSAEL